MELVEISFELTPLTWRVFIIELSWLSIVFNAAEAVFPFAVKEAYNIAIFGWIFTSPWPCTLMLFWMQQFCPYESRMMHESIKQIKSVLFFILFKKTIISVVLIECYINILRVSNKGALRYLVNIQTNFSFYASKIRFLRIEKKRKANNFWLFLKWRNKLRNKNNHFK